MTNGERRHVPGIAYNMFNKNLNEPVRHLYIVYVSLLIYNSLLKQYSLYYDWLIFLFHWKVNGRRVFWNQENQLCSRLQERSRKTPLLSVLLKQAEELTESYESVIIWISNSKYDNKNALMFLRKIFALLRRKATNKKWPLLLRYRKKEFESKHEIYWDFIFLILNYSVLRVFVESHWVFFCFHDLMICSLKCLCFVVLNDHHLFCLFRFQWLIWSIYWILKKFVFVIIYDVWWWRCQLSNWKC